MEKPAGQQATRRKLMKSMSAATKPEHCSRRGILPASISSRARFECRYLDETGSTDEASDVGNVGRSGGKPPTDHDSARNRDCRTAIGGGAPFGMARPPRTLPPHEAPGRPLAVWLALRNLSEQMMRRQADDIGRVLDDVRNFYANDVVGRILDAKAPATASHNYRSESGAVPIPATFSIELGRIVSTRDNSLSYRFVSDYPFNGREPARLDPFE